MCASNLVLFWLARTVTWLRLVETRMTLTLVEPCALAARKEGQEKQHLLCRLGATGCGLVRQVKLDCVSAIPQKLLSLHQYPATQPLLVLLFLVHCVLEPNYLCEHRAKHHTKREPNWFHHLELIHSDKAQMSTSV